MSASESGGIKSSTNSTPAAESLSPTRSMRPARPTATNCSGGRRCPNSVARLASSLPYRSASSITSTCGASARETSFRSSCAEGRNEASNQPTVVPSEVNFKAAARAAVDLPLPAVPERNIGGEPPPRETPCLAKSAKVSWAWSRAARPSTRSDHVGSAPSRNGSAPGAGPVALRSETSGILDADAARAVRTSSFASPSAAASPAGATTSEIHSAKVRAMCSAWNSC